MTFWCKSVYAPTCAGNLSTGVLATRECIYERNFYGVIDDQCIGVNSRFYRKSAKFFGLTGDHQEASKAVCEQNGLQLFTALFLLCDGSNLFDWSMVFWTDFKRDRYEEEFWDSRHENQLIKGISLWGLLQPDFIGHREFCIWIEFLTIQDIECDRDSWMKTNTVVCDYYYETNYSITTDPLVDNISGAHEFTDPF